MRIRQRRIPMIAAATTLALVLAACGGADDDGVAEEPDSTEDVDAEDEPDDNGEDADSEAEESAGGVPSDIDYGDYTPACDDPTEVHGFLTCADVDAALAEGEVVLYAPSFEPAQVAVLREFNNLFPEIYGRNVRLQTGALYSRLLQEREAEQYGADVLVLSDMSMLREFQENEGFEHYVSPEIYAYPFPEHLSDPVGYFTSWGTLSAGIAYSPTHVSPEDAPESWADLLDPQWEGRINFKNATSGLQMLQWWILKEELGDEYWEQMAEMNTNHFDSMVQQYERLVSGEDLVSGLAQYSGYLEAIRAGADLEFVIPPDGGLPAGPESFGLIQPRPNPEAGKLFIDFLHSERGQAIVQAELNYHSVRADMPPPEGGVPTEEADFRVPADWEEYAAARPEFEEVWSRITGQ